MESIKEKIIHNFLKQCLVVDTESTGLDPHSAEICEIGVTAMFDGRNVKTKEMLFGTNTPIPFAASAKNNISRDMLKGLKTVLERTAEVSDMLQIDNENIKYFVAHNFKYDKTILESTFRTDTLTTGNRASYHIIKCLDNMKWLCTYRLAQHLFKPSEDDPNLAYALNYLRYAFDLQVEGGVHRAGDDSKVTWELLKFIAEYVLEAFSDEELTENFDLGDYFFDLSKSMIKIDVMPFGKHKGEKLSEIPDSYYKWMLDKSDMLDETKDGYNPDFAESVLEELNRRMEQKA